MTAEDEEQCLRRSLRRTAWAFGVLVVACVAVAVVIAIAG